MEQIVELVRPGKKTLKDILREGIFDIIGFDRGVLKTLVDLVRQPDKVIMSYHRSDLTYTRPVAFIILAASLFLLISNYLVDWEGAFDGVAGAITALSGKPADPGGLAEARKTWNLIVDAFFRKYIVVLYILISFMRAASLVRIAKDASFANMLVIMLYRNACSLMIQAAFLLVMLVIQNVYGFIFWVLISGVVDTYLFRNYIDKTLGHGTKRPFQKRVILVIVIIFAVAMLLQVILEYFAIIG